MNVAMEFNNKSPKDGFSSEDAKFFGSKSGESVNLAGNSMKTINALIATINTSNSINPMAG